MSYRTPAVVFVFALYCAASTAPADSASSAPPELKTGTVYAETRPVILKAGWKPFRTAVDAGVCKSNDPRCKDYPETSACETDAAATCKFVWLSEPQELDVYTTGASPRVLGVEILVKGKSAMR
jgi:hypothetical protein